MVICRFSIISEKMLPDPAAMLLILMLLNNVKQLLCLLVTFSRLRETPGLSLHSELCVWPGHVAGVLVDVLSAWLECVIHTQVEWVESALSSVCLTAY